MSCTTVNGDYADALINGQFMDAFFCPMYDLLGVPLTALLLLAPICLGIYVWSESTSLPLVIVIVAGAMILPSLPSRAIQFVVIVLLIGIPTAALILMRRASNQFP